MGSAFMHSIHSAVFNHIALPTYYEAVIVQLSFDLACRLVSC